MAEKTLNENVTTEEQEAKVEAEKEAVEQEETVKKFDKYEFTLRNPIKFEGKEITKIDLHNFQNATTADLIRATDLARLQGISVEGANYEYAPAFIFALVASVCNVPKEMIDKLSLQDGYLLRRRVLYFLMY